MRCQGQCIYLHAAKTFSLEEERVRTRVAGEHNMWLCAIHKLSPNLQGNDDKLQSISDIWLYK